MIDQGEAEDMANELIERFEFVPRRIRFARNHRTPPDYIKVGGLVIHPPFFIEQEIDADGVLQVKIRIPEANPAWDLLKKAVEGDTIEE